MKIHAPGPLIRLTSLGALILLASVSSSAQAMSKHPDPMQYTQERAPTNLAGYEVRRGYFSHRRARHMTRMFDIDTPARNDHWDFPRVSTRFDSSWFDPSAYNQSDDISRVASTEWLADWMLGTYRFETGFLLGLRKGFALGWMFATINDTPEPPAAVPVPAALWLFVAALGSCALRLRKTPRRLITSKA